MKKVNIADHPGDTFILMNSEFEFIRMIRDRVAAGGTAEVIEGIGDDTAILREVSGRETLVTVDLLVEDVDFKLEYIPAEWLGHKALAVSLSDIAAMGGTPAQSMLSLAIPVKLSSNGAAGPFWENFFNGYFSLADKYGVTLIGGDISSSPDRLSVDSIVIGRCSSGKAVRRSTSRPGDRIYLTGAIGASAAGLKLLLGGARVNKSSDGSLEQSALRSHLKPVPRIEFGSIAGARSLAHSMIDVSDGMAQDLLHICEESRVNAIIDFDAVPVAAETSLVTDNIEDAFQFAINGGEDFELLLTADPENEPELMKAAIECNLRLSLIGEIIARENDTAAPRIFVRRHGRITPIAATGYNHFRKV